MGKYFIYFLLIIFSLFLYVSGNLSRTLSVCPTRGVRYREIKGTSINFTVCDFSTEFIKQNN